MEISRESDFGDHNYAMRKKLRGGKCAKEKKDDFNWDSSRIYRHKLRQGREKRQKSQWILW
jgi:hypothetical protein